MPCVMDPLTFWLQALACWLSVCWFFVRGEFFRMKLIITILLQFRTANRTRKKRKIKMNTFDVFVPSQNDKREIEAERQREREKQTQETRQ